jgi:hypothetical protein
MVTPRVTEVPPTGRYGNRVAWARSPSQRQLVIASLLATKSESGKPGKRRA